MSGAVTVRSGLTLLTPAATRMVRETEFRCGQVGPGGTRSYSSPPENKKQLEKQKQNSLNLGAFEIAKSTWSHLVAPDLT